MTSWQRRLTSQSKRLATNRDFDVMSYGAAGDGVTDDTQAFTDAWAAACAVDYGKLILPSNRSFLIGPKTFSGPCATNLSLKVKGTIVAPSPSSWSGLSAQTWLVFTRLNGFTIEGNGIIDGQGQIWWAQSCKVNRSKAVTISQSNNTRVKGLTFMNSPKMHLAFEKCTKVHASDLLVTAPGNSPNTDGDDCISIQTGSFNTSIKNLKCGPGHGISIGSLGQGGSFSNVSDLVVNGATLNRTTNGVRIKSWQGGKGAVSNIRFENVLMIDVANPILIDQYYCDSTTPCHNQTSAVEASGIKYENITGTSSTARAVNFACSDTVPCHDLFLENVNLTLYKSDTPASSFCSNAKGRTQGVINPKSCLAES
ncbi:hypothetical protein O6H91_04G029300 [Diphasiastrum complanatum]|uniref:Uncharacterized protein n=1 Tax=Diphasiastrum complanatum TaxID=34168 RepID=A0ACC2DV83_DIPCM|nr:hypothetical protein O6H91_04G029300 [Diphasiastrum complanatum]